MLKPRKIHTKNAKLVNVPTKAPFEFAKGTKRPRQNTPKIGPPITL